MLKQGDIVKMQDGTVGEVCWADAEKFKLIHGDHEVGRGPWYMWQCQGELASDEERAAYVARVNQ